MIPPTIKQILQNSKASVEFEELNVSDKNDDIVLKLLNKNITDKDATKLILDMYGITIK